MLMQLIPGTLQFSVAERLETNEMIPLTLIVVSCSSNEDIIFSKIILVDLLIQLF